MATNSPNTFQDKLGTFIDATKPIRESLRRILGKFNQISITTGKRLLGVVGSSLDGLARLPQTQIEPFLRKAPGLVFVSQLSWRYFFLRFFTWQLGLFFILIAVPYTFEGFGIAVKLMDVERIFRTKLFSPENLGLAHDFLQNSLLVIWTGQLVSDVWFRWMSGWFCLPLSGRNLYFGVVEASLFRTRSRYIHSAGPQIGFYQSTQNWLQRLYHIQDVQLTLDGKGFRIRRTPNPARLRQMLNPYL